MPSLQTLDFDFNARRRRLPPAGFAMLLVGAMAAAGVFSQLTVAYQVRAEARSRVELAQQDIQAMRRQRSKVVLPGPAEANRLKAAAFIAGELDTPWDGLLRVLEAAPMEHVALLSAEPVASNRQLRLTGEARNLAAMLDYLAYLQAQPGLQQAALVSHQTQAQLGSPVRFKIDARWEKP